ncbi:MAG: DUF4440 domain-containing protein [Planctomycetaceae bacterium]
MRRQLLFLLRSVLGGLLLSVGLAAPAPCAGPPRLNVAEVTSSVDSARQPVAWWAPAAARETATPLLVSLHTWSSTYKQDRPEWLAEAVEREWIYIQPDFRGVNDHPEACGSPLAMQDILDAIDWACVTFAVDRERIYLAGVSGGGHMTMQMAAHYPERFSAASAWCGPADLADWYRFHSPGGKAARYAQMIAACCGGPPGASADVDEQYRARSPVFHLAEVGDLPLDIHAGVLDGKTGSVPFAHSLRCFNTVASAQGAALVTASEMDQLWERGRLDSPTGDDTIPDDSYPRAILLRRQAGATRVTIFQGTHEALPSAACEWLSGATTGDHPTGGRPASHHFRRTAMTDAQRELLDLSRQLLDAITAGDWGRYAALCADDITCFEPEARGHLVSGLPFHKFYFDLPGGDSPRQSTIASPDIRIIGDVAVVCYVRVVQRVDAQGDPVSSTANETRIWQKTNAGWKHIHFHRTPV